MIYDYRENLKQILANTGSSDHELKAGAYSIRTICDLVLSTMQATISENVQTDSPKPVESTETKPAVKEDTNPNHVQDRLGNYSWRLIHKFHEIKDANPELSTGEFIQCANITGALFYKLIKNDNYDGIASKTNSSRSIEMIEMAKQHLFQQYPEIRKVLFDESVDSFKDTNVSPVITEVVPAKKAKQAKQATVIEYPEVKLGQYANSSEMVKDILRQTGLNNSQLAQITQSYNQAIGEVKRGIAGSSMESGVLKHIASWLKMPYEDLITHLKNHKEQTTSKKVDVFNHDDKKFMILSTTSNQEVVAMLLTKPLSRNQFLIRRNLTKILLLNNKGQDVCELSLTNPKVQNLHSGDIVQANIVNRHQAYILNVTPQNYDVDGIDSLDDCELEIKNNHWQTTGSAKTPLISKLPGMGTYSISDNYARRNRFTVNTLIDITWRKQEPNYVVIKRIHTKAQPAEGLASR